MAGQDEQDRRVILGNILYRASAHSVRPLSEREQAIFEAQNNESHRWRQLTDMIPRRNYVDIEGEEPMDDETEGPFLPDKPNTWSQGLDEVGIIGQLPYPVAEDLHDACSGRLVLLGQAVT